MDPEKKREIRNICVRLRCIGFFIRIGDAATLRVPSEFQTITLGIQAASDGDTVLVAPGDYPEWVSFSGKRITLRSEEGPSRTSIQNAIFQSGETDQSVVTEFTIKDSIHIVDSSATIVNNIVEAGLFAEGTGQPDRNPRPPIVIRGNTFRAGTLEFWGVETAVVENNGIQADIAAHSTTALTITNNVIRGSVSGEKTSFWIHQNLFYGFTNSAFSATQSFASLSHDTVVGGQSAAPAIVLFGDQWLQDSIVVGYPPLNTFGSTVVNNLVYAPDSGPLATDFSGTLENGNRVGDPLFIDAEHHDYHLGAASPAIDESSSYWLASFDMDGVPRPLDGNNDHVVSADLGCYEFLPFFPTPPTKLEGLSLPEETDLSWDSVYVATNYLVMRSLSATGPFEQIGSSAGVFFRGLLRAARDDVLLCHSVRWYKWDGSEFDRRWSPCWQPSADGRSGFLFDARRSTH